MFDNITSYSIYAKDALHITQINKKPSGQQSFFWPGWYTDQKKELIREDMSIVTINFIMGKSSKIQKKI